MHQQGSNHLRDKSLNSAAPTSRLVAHALVPVEWNQRADLMMMIVVQMGRPETVISVREQHAELQLKLASPITPCALAAPLL